MDLLTYAVSQKLRQNNDMWRYLAENQPVPQDLIADAFASVIEAYEDEEAVRLTSHYDDYLSHHIPVTFTPNGAGIQVSGEIDDVALEVLKLLHHKEDRDIVEQTIHSITNTISPGRDADITDIETFASELKRSVHENHERVHQLRTASELLDDEPASVVVHEHVRDLPDVSEVVTPIYEPVHEPLAQALADLEAAEREANQALADLEAAEREADHKAVQDEFTFPTNHEAPEQSFMEALDEPEFELSDAPEVSEAPVEDIELQDVPEEASAEESTATNEEKTDAGVTASVWNGFVKDIRDSGLHERMDLQTPLAMAKA